MKSIFSQIDEEIDKDGYKAIRDSIKNKIDKIVHLEINEYYNLLPYGDRFTTNQINREILNKL